MAEAPRISVVILAHDRRAYVRAAVASAIEQTLPRDRYEVLVFKNFQEPDLEPYLAAQGVRVHNYQAAARPQMMRTALHEARGEIFCFLDDDDMFTRDKLASVERTFAADPSLGYLHNGFQVVDEDGKPFDRTPFPQTEARVYLPAGDGRTRRLPTNALRLGFNTSSVSVRRDWLPPFLPSFDHRESEWSDALLLAAALASGRAVLSDPTKLTLYRYHESWTNILHYSPASIERIAELDRLNIAVLRTIETFSTGTSLEPLVDDDLTYVHFHQSLFGDGHDWSPRGRDFARFLIGGLHQRNFAPLYLIPLHFLSKVSRSGARRAYFRLADRYRRRSFHAPQMG